MSKRTPPACPDRAGNPISSTQALRAGSSPSDAVGPPIKVSDSHVHYHELPSKPLYPEQSLPSLFQNSQQIGDYVILEEIARGGMGVIYKARQCSLSRIVALKVVLRGQFARPEELARFRTEAQAIAHLHHPNLVSIHEVGELNGLPFFAMEYLEGGSLSRRLNHQPLPATDAVQLLLPLVQAIDYAHARGIIHRDLKPSNILLSRSSAPLQECIAKITDFGIAKQIDQDTELTRTGEILGTPSYMAPEQATGSREHIGPTVDVYSLGAILYELLTGKPPFAGEDSTNILLRVVQQDAPSPRVANPAISVDLETICLKCLEKEPNKRYTSAGMLAEDLRRFLAHEPLLARPAGFWDKTRKWMRRRPVWATVIAACVLLTTVAFASLVIVWQQAEAKAQVEARMYDSEKQSYRAQQQTLMESQTLLADALLDRGIACAEKDDIRTGLHWMIRSLEVAETIRDRSPRGATLCEAIRYNLAYWGQFAAPTELPLFHPTWAWTVDFSSDERLIVTGCADKHVRVWDARTGRRLGSELAHDDMVWGVRRHPNGRHILSIAGNEGKGEIRAFQSQPDKPGHFTLHGQPITFTARPPLFHLSPDGKYLSVLLDSGALLLLRFDEKATQPLQRVAVVAQEKVVAAAFTLDSEKVIFATRWGTVELFNIAEQKIEADAWQLADPVTALALSEDGKRLIVASHNVDNERAFLSVWNREGNTKHPNVAEFPGRVLRLALSRDAQQIAASMVLMEGKEQRGQIRLLEVNARNEAIEPNPPIAMGEPVWALTFDPTGHLLVTGCRDRYTRVFEVATGRRIAPPLKHEGNVTNLRMSQDGRRVISGSSGGGPEDYARLWELPSLRLTPRPFGPSQPLIRVQWDGADLFALNDKATALQLDPRDGKVMRTLEVVSDRMPRFSAPQHHVYFNDDPLGHRMIVTDLRTGKAVLDLSHVARTFHDAHGCQVGGRIPVYDREMKKLFLYRLSDGKPDAHTVSLTAPPSNIFTHEGSAIFGEPIFGGHSPIHSTDASGPADFAAGEVRIWDLNLNVRRSWKFSHPVGMTSLSPRGDVLLVGSPHQVKLFNVASGELIGRPFNHDGVVASHCYHPTEPLLLLGNPQGAIQMWHIGASKRIGRPLSVGDTLGFVTVRPDGSGYVAGSTRRRAIQWDHLGPATGTPEELRRWVETLTGTTFNARDELEPMDRKELTERRK